MLRIKILNEVEIPHRAELDKKAGEIERLRDDLFESTRRLETAGKKVETLREEYEAEIKVLRDRNVAEVARLSRQIEELQDNRNERQNQQALKKARQECEAFRDRLDEAEERCQDLRDEIENYQEDMKLISTQKNMIESLREENKKLFAALEEHSKRNCSKESEVALMKQKQAALRI